MHDVQALESPTTSVAIPYQLHRTGIVMRPLEGDPVEQGGVLNPGGARARNGDYLLFPRLVALGNFSRIGIARVKYDSLGMPHAVERLGIALEPTEQYELNERSGGGCEDARVTYIPSLDTYVMTYVAYGPLGPRAALAVSHDLFSWTRVGKIVFAPYHGADMNGYGNKDALLFPEPIVGPDGRLSLALLHRPMYEYWTDDDQGTHTFATPPPGITSNCWTIWISYCPIDDANWLGAASGAAHSPALFSDHHLLMLPDRPWESIRLGGGTPPIRLPEGWFTIYHGIGRSTRAGAHAGLRYSAGALVLDVADPRRIAYRSSLPILEPLLPEETSGVVADVVFPTAIDRRSDHLDVYYGMADACIGVAQMKTV